MLLIVRCMMPGIVYQLCRHLWGTHTSLHYGLKYASLKSNNVRFAWIFRPLRNVQRRLEMSNVKLYLVLTPRKLRPKEACNDRRHLIRLILQYMPVDNKLAKLKIYIDCCPPWSYEGKMHMEYALNTFWLRSFGYSDLIP